LHEFIWKAENVDLLDFMGSECYPFSKLVDVPARLGRSVSGWRIAECR